MKAQTKPVKNGSHSFHSNNRRANHVIHFGNQKVKNNTHLKYLGVVFYSTLTFKKNLVQPSAKIKTRHNIIASLSSTS